MQIGHETYRKKVTVPSPLDILELKPDELDAILDKKIVRGPTLKVADSYFMACTTEVKSHKDIRELYLKVKIHQAHARHVVCAYAINGYQTYYNQDFVDDEEHGAGRAILQRMLENNIHQRVFFVARICGAEKLGAKRIEAYLEAADEVLKQQPFNTILKVNQTFQNHEFAEAFVKEKTAERKQKASERKNKDETIKRQYKPRQFETETKQKNYDID